VIKVKTNIKKVIEVKIQQLKTLADTDKVLRIAATTCLGLMKKRIHEDGLDVDERPIGRYSKGYMILRTGSYKSSNRVTKGLNKGKLKDDGVFTKGVNKGNPRPKYNRTNDDKVVASLTRQMENDIKVIALKNNSYGIGYTNKFNFDKSQWVEATYKLKGKIFGLSTGEKQAVLGIVEKHKQDAFSG
jgi:hypothetical protein